MCSWHCRIPHDMECSILAFHIGCEIGWKWHIWLYFYRQWGQVRGQSAQSILWGWSRWGKGLLSSSMGLDPSVTLFLTIHFFDCWLVLCYSVISGRQVGADICKDQYETPASTEEEVCACSDGGWKTGAGGAPCVPYQRSARGIEAAETVCVCPCLGLIGDSCLADR